MRCSTLALLMFITIMISANSQASNDKPHFIIQQASLTAIKNLHVVSADILYVFSNETLEALNNGVALIVIVDFELKHQRKFLWDPTIASISRKYRIEHHALSGQYIVVNIATGRHQNFQSFEDVAKSLGKVRNVQLIKSSALLTNTRYRVRIRARLDIEALPAPLRPIAYFNSHWRLTSPWYNLEFMP